MRRRARAASGRRPHSLHGRSRARRSDGAAGDFIQFCEDAMLRMLSTPAAVFLVLCIAGRPAAADDADTCKSGSGDEAIAACSRVIEHDPGAISAYVARGVAWYHKGEHDRAIA